MHTNYVIGVLGGMGPEASSVCYRKIIQYAQKKHNAVQDSDYPPVLLNSIAPLGFDETGITNTAQFKRFLTHGVQALERGGADFIIIPCNTAHLFYDDMQAVVDIPILNIVTETVRAVTAAGFNTVGLFSSQHTNEMQLYDSFFVDADIKLVKAMSDEQKVFNDVIERVMGGRQNLHDVFDLKEVLRAFTTRGAEAVVLGCTELPLAFNQSHTDVKLFDTIEILVHTAVDRSLGVAK